MKTKHVQYETQGTCSKMIDGSSQLVTGTGTWV